MKRLLTLVAFFATIQASAQQVNPVPDYVFRNQMSVGRNAVTDTAAYFSIGPRYGANKGFMPPIVVDTATFSSGKRNGLLIFSVQKNKFLYWDSVRVQWSDMAGSSGSYITGSGITGYLPQFSASTTLDTSALFTLGNRLGIGTSTFAYNSTNTANMELNGAAGGILGFKRNDSARGYLWHTGDNMELANTAAGSISFNTNSATRGSISSAGVWRLHNLAGTGDRVVIASSNGTLSASTSATGLVDTTTISTRAWRQKGLDSLAALEVSGSGTTNYVAKFTAGSTIGNSLIQDNGTGVGIGGSQLDRLTIFQDQNATTTARVRNSDIGSSAYSQFVVNASGNSWGFRMGSSAANSNALDIVSDALGTPASRLRITSGGNVGIGTASPAYKLTVKAATDYNVGIGLLGGVASINALNDAQSAYTQMRIDATNLLINTYSGSKTLLNTSSDAGDYKLQVSGNIYNTGSAVLAATSGNVGIGIASPLYKMHVLNTAGESSLFLESGTTTQAALYLANANNAIFNDNSTTNNLKFFVNSATRMTINSAGELLINTTTDAGDYKLQVAGNIYTTGNIQMTGSAAIRNTVSQFIDYGTGGSGDLYIRGGSGFANVMTATNAGEVLINTTTDAGDYKLQVSGNALVTAGKLDITTNTGFGLSVSRSGTSVVAGQINNSNGILYYGAESSTGGGLFTGSSAYAAVIGSGAAYPLQFATDNVTRATINTNGELLINTTTDNGDFKLQVNGSALISGSIQTANPVSGTAVPWRLGSVVATNVQLDTANYVEVNINGTFYRLAIVTPL